MKTLFEKMILNIILLLAFTDAMAINFSRNKKDTVHCLKITGIIPCKYEDAPARVDLISYNNLIDSAVLDEGATKFKFLLKKNTSYTIRITRSGYVDRLVCIDTSIPMEEKELFKFIFTTKLMRDDVSTHLNQDALDFPIAMIYYDKEQQCFDYSKQYTVSVKRDWYKLQPSYDLSMKNQE